MRKKENFYEEICLTIEQLLNFLSFQASHSNDRANHHRHHYLHCRKRHARVAVHSVGDDISQGKNDEENHFPKEEIFNQATNCATKKSVSHLSILSAPCRWCRLISQSRHLVLTNTRISRARHSRKFQRLGCFPPSYSSTRLSTSLDTYTFTQEEFGRVS